MPAPTRPGCPAGSASGWRSPGRWGTGPRWCSPPRRPGAARQRVAIARARVTRPALLPADEPTGALDTATGEEIGELLLDLNSSGQTLILVTHNPDLAARYARRVIQLVDGSVAGDAVTGARR